MNRRDFLRRSAGLIGSIVAGVYEIASRDRQAEIQQREAPTKPPVKSIERPLLMGGTPYSCSYCYNKQMDRSDWYSD